MKPRTVMLDSDKETLGSILQHNNIVTVLEEIADYLLEYKFDDLFATRGWYRDAAKQIMQARWKIAGRIK